MSFQAGKRQELVGRQLHVRAAIPFLTGTNGTLAYGAAFIQHKLILETT